MAVYAGKLVPEQVTCQATRLLLTFSIWACCRNSFIRFYRVVRDALFFSANLQVCDVCFFLIDLDLKSLVVFLFIQGGCITNTLHSCSVFQPNYNHCTELT